MKMKGSTTIEQIRNRDPKKVMKRRMHCAFILLAVHDIQNQRELIMHGAKCVDVYGVSTAPLCQPLFYLQLHPSRLDDCSRRNLCRCFSSTSLPFCVCLLHSSTNERRHLAQYYGHSMQKGRNREPEAGEVFPICHSTESEGHGTTTAEQNVALASIMRSFSCANGKVIVVVMIQFCPLSALANKFFQFPQFPRAERELPNSKQNSKISSKPLGVTFTLNCCCINSTAGGSNAYRIMDYSRMSTKFKISMIERKSQTLPKVFQNTPSVVREFQQYYNL